MKLFNIFRSKKHLKKQQYFHQMYTPWGEKLNQNEVLKEYPRPQLKRGDYTNLNGNWDYVITESKDIPEEYPQKILVPFSPESILSGVSRQLQPNEIFWYHRTFRIQSFPDGKRCILHFGAVDCWCQVYLNHKKVKEHMGGYLPFQVDITNQLKVGINEIEVCVTDATDTSYHTRRKQKIESGGIFHTAQCGIWQTVWMEWVPRCYIEDLKIEPHYDENEVCFEFRICEDMKLLSKERYEEILTKNAINIKIYDSNQCIIATNSLERRISIKIPNKISWSPENPFLYQVKIQMGEDEIESYFAMRKISVELENHEIPRIYLNNEPYFQNGVLDQGYWPDGLYTAPSDDAMIYDITKMKELGFNMIHKHLKIEPLRWYYHCDRLGILVWQDMVSGGKYNPNKSFKYLPKISKHLIAIKNQRHRKTARKNKEGKEKWKMECRDTVRLLFNSPCIVTWVPFHEGFGQFDTNEIVTLIRSYDKTRLIDHACGWRKEEIGDIKGAQNDSKKLENSLAQRGYAIRKIGGYMDLVKNHSYCDRIHGINKSMSQIELMNIFNDLYKDAELLIEYGLSAVIYTQYCDVEEEMNGLLTYDRRITKIRPIHNENHMERETT